jgi:hypothetical protein
MSHCENGCVQQHIPRSPQADVPVASRILQELTMFTPQLPSNDATGTSSRDSLSSVGGQILTMVDTFSSLRQGLLTE